MQVKIIPIVIGAFGTVTKELLKGLEDVEIGRWVETIQTTALLRTARILRKVLDICCHSNSSGRPSANADVKNSKGVNNDNNKIMKDKTQKVADVEFVVIEMKRSIT